MADAPEPVAISALQHWCYCQRQCGLIHLEQVLQESIFTQRGQALHKRFHPPATRGAWIETSHAKAFGCALPSTALTE